MFSWAQTTKRGPHVRSLILMIMIRMPALIMMVIPVMIVLQEHMTPLTMALILTVMVYVMQVMMMMIMMVA